VHGGDEVARPLLERTRAAWGIHRGERPQSVFGLGSSWQLWAGCGYGGDHSSCRAVRSWTSVVSPSATSGRQRPCHPGLR